MNNKLRPILLAGETGSNLWPLSTQERPEQFIPLFKEYSLFDLSLQRLNKKSLFKKPIIVTSKKYLEFVESSLLRTGIDAKRIVLEPQSKDTSSAINLAVQLAIQENPLEDYFVSPSNHYISLNKNFYDSCSLAQGQLNRGGLFLMGVKPDRPSKEYSYISASKRTGNIRNVESFFEKEDIRKPKDLFTQSNIFWNSGIFIFKGSWFIESSKNINKKLYNSISRIIKTDDDKSKPFMPSKKLYTSLEKVSFDKSFVQKISKISMIELNAGWSDIGSWVSLGVAQKDPNSRLTPFSSGQYERIDKPWGFFENLMETESSKVKLLSVLPGEKLSLQKHEHRMETWYVTQGKARVTRGNERFTLQLGDSITIDKNQLHRLENNSDINLEVIEIQTGSYFGEDDITRVDDIYGRIDLH